MYKAFNIEELAWSPIESIVLQEVANGVIAAPEKQMRDRLSSLASSAPLDGTKIRDQWFPQVDADIFISHSHGNRDLALTLTGWLYRNFGLRAFVDSSIWGYSDDLLKMIDDEFCKNEDNQTYDYHRRNGSTSHVHMMLAAALMSMIDRAECLMFINTPQSITTDEVVQKTRSPWIYTEILTAGIVRQQRRRTRGVVKAAMAKGITENRALEIQYEVEHLDAFEKLSNADLEKWLREFREVEDDDVHALDVLYAMG